MEDYFCSFCEAMVRYECVCPNHKKMKNWKINRRGSFITLLEVHEDLFGKIPQIPQCELET